MCDYDESGSIGKRYRREDEIGTPFCICVDFETEEDGAVGSAQFLNKEMLFQERSKE